MMSTNQTTFIANLAERLGRKTPTEVTIPTWKHSPQHRVLQNKTQDELYDVLQEQCKRINTTCMLTTTADVANTLQQVITTYGGGPIVAWQDERFETFGALATLQANETHIWDTKQGRKNIEYANEAMIGITIADYMLAESGTGVLLSNENHGRTVSFLPQKSIILVPKSAIMPRSTQATNALRQRIKNGESVPSCINFISGPSNSADIEMILVVGVHGPMHMTYIVIDDL